MVRAVPSGRQVLVYPEHTHTMAADDLATEGARISAVMVDTSTGIFQFQQKGGLTLPNMLLWIKTVPESARFRHGYIYNTYLPLSQFSPNIRKSTRVSLLTTFAFCFLCLFCDIFFGISLLIQGMDRHFCGSRTLNEAFQISTTSWFFNENGLHWFSLWPVAYSLTWD